MLDPTREFSRRSFCMAWLVLGTALLSACGEPAPDPEALAKANAIPDRALFGASPCEETEGETPADADAQTATTASANGLATQLQAIYARSCQICHENPAAGAPLRGDHEAWAPRIAQGMPLLMEHTIHGYKQMPPLGLCMSCTEPELEALIRYMAGDALQEKR